MIEHLDEGFLLRIPRRSSDRDPAPPGGGARPASAESGLLPRSEAPAVRTERDELDATLRRAVLDAANPDLLWRYGLTAAGAEDLEVWETLTADLTPGDARRPAVSARRRRLAADLGN